MTPLRASHKLTRQIAPFVKDGKTLSSRVHIVLIAVALALVGGVVALAARTGRSQSQKSQTQSPVKRTSSVRNLRSASRMNCRFAAAAERNSTLKTEMTGLSAAKPTRWYLYDQLYAAL